MKEFVSSSEKAVNKGLRSGRWPVYSEYEIREANGFKYVYAPPFLRDRTSGAKQSSGRPRRRRNRGEDYTPLVRTPGLFLEFAQLVDDGELDTETSEDGWLYGELETEKNTKGMLDWVERYGVLGLSPPEGYRTLDQVRDALKREPDQASPVDAGIVISPPWGAPWEPRRWTPELMREVLDAGPPGPPILRGVSERGGKKDTVTRFVVEAVDANRTLRLYEAAAGQGDPDVEAIRSLMPREFEGVAGTLSWFRDRALGRVEAKTQEMVSNHCHPALYRRRDGALVDGYGFRSLLGAMWLQMRWLLRAPPENVRHCLWCNRVIAFEQPEQSEGDPGLKKNARGGYRTRKDKKFCDDHCRAKHYYHARVKPRR